MSDDDFLDVRIALVLYGGVSLAIYENGVTRCFYELVERRGVFSILLDLLGAKAQVDVIAGTSAGGINGVLLAATLESGADFTQSAALWRRLGDFGALLRDVKDADTAQSLLKGETYYQDSLIEALQTYCTPPNPARFEEYPNEIDVFVTGTDLDGAERTNWDALGAPISDREHRVVFHLEHRANRKALGYGRQNKAATDPHEQGTILGTIARITSSFPAAFPPFRLSHLEAKHKRYVDAVRKALEGTARSGIAKINDRSFADGGLLDNKPFGPMLEAIFHRMPTGVVDRRLFYVEPDPEPRPPEPDPDRHSPLAVAAAALSTIPAHESIWGDLQQLERHNAQVRWIKRLKTQADDDVRRRAGAAGDTTAWSLYWETRCESLARSLFLASEVTSPSAEDPVTNPAHRQLVQLLGEGLRMWIEPAAGETPDGFRIDRPLLNAFDVDFHLRRTFHLLYGLFGTLQQHSQDASPESGDACRAAMRLTGRIIKAQKMIRDFLLVLRENVLREASPPPAAPISQDLRATALYIVNLFRLFLRADAPHWESLRRHCAVQPEALRGMGVDWPSFFHSDDLSIAAESAGETVRKPTANLTRHLPESGRESDLRKLLGAADLSVRWTILDEIERATNAVVDTYCRNDERLGDLAVVFDGFMRIDAVTYPLEFAGAVYELDEIEYVRISPQDAQTGLSEGDPRQKVAGDELAHFSAFLRQDWRSNDILQGRFDGICQIVRSLLGPSAETARRLAGYCAVGEQDPERAFNVQLRCRDESRSALQNAWRDLAAVLAGEAVTDKRYTPSPRFVAALNLFQVCLIRVGQEDAFLEDFPSVLDDHFYQELAFASTADSRGDTPTSTTVQECEAKQRSRKCLETDGTVDSWWERYKKMKLGGQAVGGRDGGVPPHIVGEYATQAYLLLYGMIRSSLGETGQAVLDQKTVRSVLLHPLAFLHVIFNLMRRAYTVALGSIATTAGLLIGAAALAYFMNRTALMLGAIAALLSFMAIVAWAVPRMKKRQLWAALLPAVFLLALVLVVVIGLELPARRDAIMELLGGPYMPIVFLAGMTAGVLASVIFIKRR